MAIKTTLEQLEEVQAEITAVLTGAQSYTLDGRTVMRARLKELETREEKLLARYKEETSPSSAPKVSYANLGGF